MQIWFSERPLDGPESNENEAHFVLNGWGAWSDLRNWWRKWTRILDSVEYYDPKKNVWRNATPMIKARATAGVAVFNNAIYAIGGSTMLHFGDTETVERYDLDTRQWSLVIPKKQIEYPTMSNLQPICYCRSPHWIIPELVSRAVCTRMCCSRPEDSITQHMRWTTWRSMMRGPTNGFGRKQWTKPENVVRCSSHRPASTPIGFETLCQKIDLNSSRRILRSNSMKLHFYAECEWRMNYWIIQFELLTFQNSATALYLHKPPMFLPHRILHQTTKSCNNSFVTSISGTHFQFCLDENK